MKLRLRSVETKETHRIEIPNPSSLQHLKQLIYQSIPSLSPSLSIHLSLNRSTELVSSSPEESIQSLGITSGDLIYFTTNPNSFSPNPTAPSPQKGETSNSRTLESDKGKSTELVTQKEGMAKLEDTHMDQTLDLDTHVEDVVEDVVEGMEIDSDSKSFSVPGFLRRVFSEELGEDSGRNHKLLVIAIHAVLLESGFVGFDPSLKTSNYRFVVPEKWPTGSLRMSLKYTLPEFIVRGGDDVDNAQYVVLKFNNIGKFFDVYGSLPNGGGVHWVRLDEDRLVPFLNVIWANCSLTDGIVIEEGVVGTSTTPEREVFEFWRRVKDMLALPLLIDLCERAGFELPPCFMRLPTDLKLKILELLPGVDIAKVGSLCSELRYLTASEDLWKKKYEEEQFGFAERSAGPKKWKERFKMSWGVRKRVENAMNRRPYYEQDRRQRFPLRFPRGRNPFPPRFPSIIGDRDDILPRPFGTFLPTQPGIPGLPFARRRNTMPHCNLGEGNM